MKKSILFGFVAVLMTACVSVRFPEKINIDIHVPADVDLAKLEVIVDTLRAQSKKVNATVEFKINADKN